MVGGEETRTSSSTTTSGIIRQLHEAMPDVHLKCFTASEIHHMTKLSGLTHEEVARELHDAGLGSLPGGGAEIFADRVRRLVAPGKEHPDFWFHAPHGAPARHPDALHDALRTRRRPTGAGRPSPAAARAAGRDRRFPGVHPLAFHPHNTVFERRGWTFTPGSDDLKLIAVSRLLLDNIPHVKAYWIMMGLPLAQVALHFGADDVQGTVVREEIFHAAGARAETEQKIEELVRVVQAAGRVPVSGTRSTTRCDGGSDRVHLGNPDHPGA